MAERVRLTTDSAPKRRRRKRKIGRGVTILDEKLIRQFCKLVAKRGLPPDGCCDYLGIQPATFWEWMRKGEAYVQGATKSSGDAIFGEFHMRLRKAFAKYRLWALDNLHEAGRNWTCWMTILERRDRPNFSRFDTGGSDMEDYNPDERFL